MQTELSGITFPMESGLSGLLEKSAAMHRHLCPRQVLGVRMGLLGAELLHITQPHAQKDMYVIAEIDGCTVDGISVATDCWVGRRTLRIEDYGKVAATFVDVKTNAAFRLVPKNDIREKSREFAPGARGNWEAALIGYQMMPYSDLFSVQIVELLTPVEKLISRMGRKEICSKCGEEINNGREVTENDLILCATCAGKSYYRRVYLSGL